jgi:HEPN superfamily AbiU2-like protein
VNTERIVKLEAQVDSLLGLLVRAYAKFFFLRPMMLNEGLNQTISSEERGACFRQLRNWLYWDFVLELVKVCDDSDERTPSIRQLKEALADTETLPALKEKYSRRAPLRGLDEETAQQLQNEEEQKLRSEFDEVYARFQKNADELLSSSAFKGFQTIRHKLIAHNQLRKTDAGYEFFDIKVLYLKYGEERKLLAAAQTIVDDLDLLVRNGCFDWYSFFQMQEKDVCKFWSIPKIEWLNSPNTRAGMSSSRLTRRALCKGEAHSVKPKRQKRFRSN